MFPIFAGYNIKLDLSSTLTQLSVIGNVEISKFLIVSKSFFTSCKTYLRDFSHFPDILIHIYMEVLEIALSMGKNYPSKCLLETFTK